MKKPLLIIIVVLSTILTAWLTYKYIFTPTKDEINVTTLTLTCSNGYKITAKYHTPDENGVLSKVSLKVSKDNINNPYEMDSVIAASGAKFETSDEKYFFWEHQGTFVFGIDEENSLAECFEKK
ncbi:MAG: MliC family protein [bacterium]